MSESQEAADKRTPEEQGASDAKTEKKGSPEGRLTEGQARLLLIGLTIFVAILAVLTADQIFEWGIMRPELDRRLLLRIDSFDRSFPDIPTRELAKLSARAASLVGRMPPEMTAALRRIEAASQGFEVGAPPAPKTLDELDKDLAKLKKAPRLRPYAARIKELEAMAAELRRLRATVPAEKLKDLARHRDEDVEYVINYHEFSVPHLIRALRKGSPAVKAAAAYCLRQIAGRFFNHRGDEGADPDKWGEWWAKKERELERRSKR